jgi:hypothetical protein
MRIFSRLSKGDGDSTDDAQTQEAAEAPAQDAAPEPATVHRPPPPPDRSRKESLAPARVGPLPSKRPKPPEGAAKSASNAPAGPVSGRGGQGGGRRSSPPSKRPPTSSKPPDRKVPSLPPLVLESDFPPPNKEPPKPADKSAAAKPIDEVDLASEFEARFDASWKKSDRPDLARAEPARDSVTTEQDMMAIRDLFNDLAVHHMAQVRDLMLELGRVEVATTWVSLCEPTVQSMRTMCEKLDIPDLSQALEDFAAALAVAKNALSGVVQGETREQLLAAYARMMEILPCAFELGSGREAMLLQLLLLQVPGVHKLTIDKLYAAGLHQLDAFLSARPDELAAVAGIDLRLAESIAKHFRDYRQSFRSVLAEPVPAEERRRLAGLVQRLRGEHTEFERASAGWSPEARADKRRLRRERSDTLSSIYVSLVRLGEVQRVDALKKKPIGRQLEELEEYLRRAPVLG